jgi:pyridoxine kinase
MPAILSLSSQVAYGHVGHAAAAFAWQRLGLNVIALPTVILSNRPGYPHRAGLDVSPEALDAMLQALDANGWLSGIDAVFTGYMPSAAHVALAAGWVARLRGGNPGLFYACDPILGDDPGGLYIAREAAVAIRDSLVPLASLITPNRYELSWLSGQEVGSTENAEAAAAALAPITLTTSLPRGADRLSNILHCGSGTWEATVARRAHVAHGTGDLMAALFLGHYLLEGSLPHALALATGGLESVITASGPAAELHLLEAQDRWAAPEPWPLMRLA